MSLWFIKLKTGVDLGLINILRVVIYRLSIKTGLNSAFRLKSEILDGPFFKKCSVQPKNIPGNTSWQTTGVMFGHFNFPLSDTPPNWFVNHISGNEFPLPYREWWQIADFDESAGDIKLIWELSRMDWVVALAQRARNGDNESLEKLNIWLVNWSSENKPYKGPNWKCGQEASIRVLNLACASLILEQHKNTNKSLKMLLKVHLRRIAATISYGIAQDNNHGTSEAAALFIGGSWLSSQGSKEGAKWEKCGRNWLENRAKKLIAADGCFSQYSTNYHRLMLDTFSFVEIWRRELDLHKFSVNFYDKSAKAANWLYQIVSPKNGLAPNLGANDGAQILQLTDSDYCDFRPSVQLATSLFEDKNAFISSELLDSHLNWLGVSIDKLIAPPQCSFNFDGGGFSVIRNHDAMAVLRVPNSCFRPGQSDALHLDFWINGHGIFRDAGSFSYNSFPDLSWYFSGTAGHNTVQFDDRDQMPKLGRFLYGSWLKTKYVSPVSFKNGYSSCSASYRDYQGAEHSRQVNLSDTSLSIYDEVKGFREKAVIRWRLSDSEYNLELIENGVKVKNGLCVIVVTSNTPIVRADIVQGWMSMFYIQKQSVPILEVEISGAGIITTDVRWQQ